MNFLEDAPRESALPERDEDILALSVKKPSMFSLLVDRYEEAFMRKAQKILRNKESAEDVVQEAFTKIYLYAPRFHEVEGASFKSWGYKILINTALSAYAKAKKKGTLSLDDEELGIGETIHDDEHFLPHLEARDYIASVMVRLPDKARRALTTHFLEEKSQKEIAVAERTSVSAIKTRIHRAKKEFIRAAAEI